MKRFYFLPLAFMILLAACNDSPGENEGGTGEKPDTEEPNIYYTGKDKSSVVDADCTDKTIGKEYSVLGYGYDLTGKYAHPGWVRERVVDIAKVLADYPDAADINRYGSWGNRGLAWEGTRGQILEALLPGFGFQASDAEKYPAILSGMFDLPFVADDSFSDETYYYAINSLEWIDCRYNIFLFNRYTDYITDEFSRDLEAEEPMDIVKKYGTHIILAALTGYRDEAIFRATSDGELNARMVHALSDYLGANIGIWTSEPAKEYKDKENIYLEFTGGDIDSTHAWMVDVTNRGDKKLDIRGRGEFNEDDPKYTLVDFYQPQYNLVPVYEFVKDADLRESIKKAYEDYLAGNL